MIILNYFLETDKKLSLKDDTVFFEDNTRTKTK